MKYSEFIARLLLLGFKPSRAGTYYYRRVGGERVVDIQVIPGNYQTTIWYRRPLQLIMANKRRYRTKQGALRYINKLIGDLK